jgi:hypothetical protein
LFSMITISNNQLVSIFVSNSIFLGVLPFLIIKNCNAVFILSNFKRKSQLYKNKIHLYYLLWNTSKWLFILQHFQHFIHLTYFKFIRDFFRNIIIQNDIIESNINLDILRKTIRRPLKNIFLKYSVNKTA